MQKIPTYFLTLIGCSMLLACQGTYHPTLSLSGKWKFSTDSADVGVAESWYARSLPNCICLPGTTDDAGYGTPNVLPPSIQKPQILHLTRKNSYIGPAWYSKEINIPSNWKNKSIELKLERVIWHTSLWVDGKSVCQTQESLVSPHKYDLTSYLTPGKHILTLRIDNRKQYDITSGDMAHAYTNETQIMWNGVIGELSLTAKDAVSFKDIQVYPDLKKRQVKVRCLINNRKNAKGATITVQVRPKGTSEKVVEKMLHINLKPGSDTIEMVCPVKRNIKEWNEFEPNLYTLRAHIQTGSDQDQAVEHFGFRDLKRQDKNILLNGKRVFLRGTLECCVFPLTGYPPMEKEGWEKVFNTAREWGLNHLRFHSWCPPEAAFQVADSLGFYLQVELPLWATNLTNDKRAPFLYAEADHILQEYGNHPSFCLFSLGNELQYDFHFLDSLLSYVKGKDSRHLYTTTSFTFEQGHGDRPEAKDDYLVTQWTQKGWVRGQGVFNSQPPCFDKDYSLAVKDIQTPVITHEIGQYAVYPDLREIEQYTGVLDPLNFKGVKAELAKKGLLTKAGSYLTASGKLASILYKEEIERALKTEGISGFQLLDLHDFPGQGTALVGLLNAFWENKGVITSSDFRQFCSPVTPLARFPKAVYTSDETFNANLEIANYGQKTLKDIKVKWNLKDKNGHITARGELPISSLPIGKNTVVGQISCPLHNFTHAQQLTFSVSLSGTSYANQWNIWVYPSSLTIDKDGIVVTDSLDIAQKALQAGKKVLFNPPYNSFKGVEGKFVPVFWSPVHFPKQAGTMGLLLDPNHPAFRHFPTNGHTDWQWWPLVTQSRVLCIDSLHMEMTPLVECIDNFVYNRRLTNLFESRCLNGKLIVCSMNLLKGQTQDPAIRQLLYSLIEYMKSGSFRPERQLCVNHLKKLFEPQQKPAKPDSTKNAGQATP